MLGTALFLLIVLLAISVPVAAVMGVLGLALNQFYSSMPLYRAMGDIIWNASAEYILIAIPMFVMLGEVLLRSGIAVRVYNAMAKWLSWLPGGLMHANIGTCAIFAATSGSSVATAATVGVVALPQVKIRGYDESLFLGTLAAGGTLGILIPPSINFILYGLITSTSVPRLYLAGMIPGLLLTSFFMLIVLVYCVVTPSKGGTKLETSWSDRIASLKDLIAPLFIFFIVVGSIYLGWATPTEAASMGVFAALILAAWERALSWKMLRAVFEGTMRTTAMIMLIIIAAQFLNFVLATIGLTDGIGNLIEGLGLGKYGTMLLIVVFYLILGCFMETISMMILTTPFIYPIVTKLGWDPIWWGVVLTILIEAALVTPPVGLNLYVVQSLRERGPIADVIRGALPFVIGMVALIVLLMAASRRGPLAAQPRHGQGMSATLGVDVGGTFTDFFLVDDATGETRTHKVASTPDDPSRAILQGLRALAPARRPRPFLAHGTTVATNALIQRRGGKVALVTTEGFKDLLEIGRQTQAQDLRPEGRPPRAAGAARAPLRGGRARRSGGRGHPAARRRRHPRAPLPTCRRAAPRAWPSASCSRSSIRGTSGAWARRCGRRCPASTCRSPARCSPSSASTSGCPPPCSTPSSSLSPAGT